MTPFEQYLISIGYKRYRKIYAKKQWNYIEDNGNYSFSTMSDGGLDYRYIKDGDFENEFIYGLEEKGKPPHLVWPAIFDKNAGLIDEHGNHLSYADRIMRLMKEKAPAEIYTLCMVAQQEFNAKKLSK